jgi:hypothetical protein
MGWEGDERPRAWLAAATAGRACPTAVEASPTEFVPIHPMLEERGC